MRSLLSIVLLLALSCGARCNPLSVDQALLQLKSAIDPSGSQLSNWIPGTNVCAWRGIVCDSTGVYALNLNAVGLSGSLPDDAAIWSSLTSLREMDLSNNQLAGTLPASLPNAPKLMTIALANNRFTGELPATWGSMQTTSIQLSNNQLSGYIPSTWTLMPKLQNLGLSGNNLVGPIPWAATSQQSGGTTQQPAAPQTIVNVQNNPGVCGGSATQPPSNVQLQYSSTYLVRCDGIASPADVCWCTQGVTNMCVSALSYTCDGAGQTSTDLHQQLCSQYRSYWNSQQPIAADALQQLTSQWGCTGPPAAAATNQPTPSVAPSVQSPMPVTTSLSPQPTVAPSATAAAPNAATPHVLPDMAAEAPTTSSGPAPSDTMAAVPSASGPALSPLGPAPGPQGPAPSPSGPAPSPLSPSPAGPAPSPLAPAPSLEAPAPSPETAAPAPAPTNGEGGSGTPLRFIMDFYNTSTADFINNHQAAFNNVNKAYMGTNYTAPITEQQINETYGSNQTMPQPQALSVTASAPVSSPSNAMSQLQRADADGSLAAAFAAVGLDYQPGSLRFPETPSGGLARRLAAASNVLLYTLSFQDVSAADFFDRLKAAFAKVSSNYTGGSPADVALQHLNETNAQAHALPNMTTILATGQTGNVYSTMSRMLAADHNGSLHNAFAAAGLNYRTGSLRFPDYSTVDDQNAQAVANAPAAAAGSNSRDVSPAAFVVPIVVVVLLVAALIAGFVVRSRVRQRNRRRGAAYAGTDSKLDALERGPGDYDSNEASSDVGMRDADAALFLRSVPRELVTGVDKNMEDSSRAWQSMPVSQVLQSMEHAEPHEKIVPDSSVEPLPYPSTPQVVERQATSFDGEHAVQPPSETGKTASPHAAAAPDTTAAASGAADMAAAPVSAAAAVPYATTVPELAETFDAAPLAGAVAIPAAAAMAAVAAAAVPSTSKQRLSDRSAAPTSMAETSAVVAAPAAAPTAATLPSFLGFLRRRSSAESLDMPEMRLTRRWSDELHSVGDSDSVVDMPQLDPMMDTVASYRTVTTGVYSTHASDMVSTHHSFNSAAIRATSSRQKQEAAALAQYAIWHEDIDRALQPMDALLPSHVPLSRSLAASSSGDRAAVSDAVTRHPSHTSSSGSQRAQTITLPVALASIGKAVPQFPAKLGAERMRGTRDSALESTPDMVFDGPKPRLTGSMQLTRDDSREHSPMNTMDSWVARAIRMFSSPLWSSASKQADQFTPMAEHATDASKRAASSAVSSAVHDSHATLPSGSDAALDSIDGGHSPLRRSKTRSYVSTSSRHFTE